MMTLMLALGALTGCSAEDEEPEATRDVKVDRVDPEQAVESEFPRACVSSGKTYVTWQDARDGVTAVYVNATVDGGASWMAGDVRLNAGTAPARAPAIACAGDDVWVVWEDERDGALANRNIRLNRSTDGGRSWLEEDVALDGDPEGDAMSLGPRVAAADGDVYVSWFDSRNGAYDVFVQASSDGGASWLDTATRVESDAAGEGYSAWAELAVDKDGRVVVAWEDSRNGASDVYVARSTDGGLSFDEDVRLDGGSDGTNSFLPRLAMAGDAVHVVWHDERNGDARDVYVASSQDGGATWPDEPTRLDADGAGQNDSLNPDLVAFGDRVHVVWQDDRGGGYDVYYRASFDGGVSFGDELRLDTDVPGEAQSYDASIAAVGNGVVVTWEDRRADADEGFNDLYYNWSGDGGKTFQDADLRINSNAPASSWAIESSVHVDVANERIVTVWADGRFGSGDVFYASRAFGEDSVYVPPEEDDEAEAKAW